MTGTPHGAPTALAGRRIVAVDIETTGWSPREGHTMLEIACVTLDDGVVTATWSSLVNPKRPIPAAAREIHGIDDVMAGGAPDGAVVAPVVRATCGDLPLAFHNAPFDLAFLRPFLHGSGPHPLANPVVDTLGLARGLFGPGNNTLGALRETLGLPAGSAHRALGDALTTASALLVLAPRWERERGIATLEALAAASQDALRAGARRGTGAESVEAVVSSGRITTF